MLLLGASGLTRRDLAGTALDDWFYGFFFDRYPLFTFAILYGLARIVVGAFGSGEARPVRLLSVPLGVMLFLAICLYPTFGGLVVRAGFATGGVLSMSQPLALAYTAGTAAAAALYGVSLALAQALAECRSTPSRSSLLRRLAGFLALWWAAGVLLVPHAFAVEVLAGWPGRPPDASTELVAALLMGAALLPHALLCATSPREA